MAKKNKIPMDKNIINLPIEEAMPENYLPYAVEVAKDRALPDVRDGLKPVHRRILYGAYRLNALPDKPYYKSARIVGDILGKFHPHGDSSVYSAMAILAQDFSTRNPLIDGHGNWGSIDGDSAAAMRYTEARLSKLAMMMLQDIEKETVDYTLNYSDSEYEPVVLPSRYPNLLVNGAFGIAVGLATNIPPHNITESIDASIAYIDNPEITTEELLTHIKGPDFPTGGVLLKGDDIVKVYERGKGKLVLRAKTKIERLTTGRYAIIINEFPYRKNKARILEQISTLTANKRHQKALEGISDIRDESDREGIRAVIEFKTTIDKKTAEKILLYLYRISDLQVNINYNMVAICNGKPEMVSLKDILFYYVEHQKDVVRRRTKKELKSAKERFHIVEGFIKAIDIMDDILNLIRKSKSKSDARENLIKEFEFTKEQANAVLELMLYRLTGLELKEYQKEYNELKKLIMNLNKILKSEKTLNNLLKKEMLAIKKEFNDNRRTELISLDDNEPVELSDIIIEEDVMVTISSEGFIKRLPFRNYQRVTTTPDNIDYREEDSIVGLLKSNTKDIIYMFTDKGNLYQIETANIPERKWIDKGQRLDNYINGADFLDEKIIATFSLKDTNKDAKFKFITSHGKIKNTKVEEFKTNYSKLIALKLNEDEKIIDVILETDNANITNNYDSRLKEVEKSNKNDLYIQLETKRGFIYSVKEPRLKESKRMITPEDFVYLTSEDEIINFQYLSEVDDSIINLTISKNGEIKKVNRKSQAVSLFTISDTSDSNIALITEKGILYKLPMYLFQNDFKSANLKSIIKEFDDKDSVVYAFSYKEDRNLDYELVFMTKDGITKRLDIKEIYGSYDELSLISFKNQKDLLIYSSLINKIKNKEIIAVTKDGYALRFNIELISKVGRNAIGVIGIRLNKNDQVIFASVDYITTNKFEIINTLDKKTLVKISEIPNQNRATLGKKIIGKGKVKKIDLI